MTKTEVVAQAGPLHCEAVPRAQQDVAGGVDEICVDRDTSLAAASATLKVSMRQDVVMLIIFNGIEARRYEELAKLLTEKYGPPSEGDESMQRWSIGGRKLQIMEHDSRLETSVFLVQEEDLKEAGERREAAKRADL